MMSISFVHGEAETVSSVGTLKRKLKKNCPGYSQQAIVFSTENYPLALTYLWVPWSLCCTKCSKENCYRMYRMWLSACFLLRLDDSFFMSGAQICIQHMKITTMSSLFNLQHPENITCSFYFSNTLAQGAY